MFISFITLLILIALVHFWSKISLLEPVLSFLRMIICISQHDADFPLAVEGFNFFFIGKTLDRSKTKLRDLNNSLAPGI